MFKTVRNISLALVLVAAMVLVAYAATTYDNTAGSAIGQRTFTRVGVVNLALLNSGAGLGATDVIQVIDIDAGETVIDVWTRVKTAEGDTLTFDVGDNDGAASWDSNVNGNAAANTMTRTTVGTDAYSIGKYYAVANTIDITLDHAAGTAIIEVIAVTKK